MAVFTRRRALAGLVVLGAGLVVVAVLGRSYVLARAESELTQRGCTAQAMGWSGMRLRASDIQCPGASIGSATVQPWPLAITLRNADVDLAAWLPTLADNIGNDEQAISTLSHTASLLATARVEGLSVRMGELVLVRDLRGGLDPIQLEGPDFLLSQQEDTLRVEHRRVIEGPPVRGEVQLVATWNITEDQIQGSLTSTSLSVSHELLAPEPLTGLAMELIFDGSTGGMERPWLRGSASLGGPQARWQAQLDDEGLPVLDLELPDSPAAELLAPFAPIVPELDLATIQGDIGLAAQWKPGRDLQVTPRIVDLEVEGALEPDLGLDWGAFTYLIRDDADERVPRRSGDNTAGWTPMAEISPDLVHALLAAEDSAYFRHAGYHLPAIQEALNADLAAGEVVRGGSTLTQQLAKNLFLDGEQTAARKLRELLLAVELDHTLGKDRVLELYLNVVEFGPGIHGVAAASERYFMKKPSRLALHEAVFLAALLPSPRSAYEHWYLQGRPNRTRMALILDNMVDGQWIGPRQAERAKQARLSLVPPPK